MPGKSLPRVAAAMLQASNKRTMHRHFVLVSALAIWMNLSMRPLALPSEISNQTMCDQAAVSAAGKSNVPVAVMRAITRAETGRPENGKLNPWPWTVNMEGKGVWFDSEEEARTYVLRHFKAGARSFDVGCFQINYKWHGASFSSIEDMFDPVTNAEYAAEFLRSLYTELGNWSKAAGAYHSRTPEFADKYRDRFDRIRAALGDIDVVSPLFADIGPAKQERQSGRLATTENLYPFLKTGGAGKMGSLVPITSGTGQALFSPMSRSGS